MFELCNSFNRLRDMHIHFVAIEVSIIWRAHRKVESEGIVGKDFNPMSHHAHPV